MTEQLVILAVAFLFAAALYASVGHAGGSAYLAVMALVSVAPATMRPTALALNILVATLVTLRFALAGQVRWRAVLPFVLGSVPAAFIGGALTLPGDVYKPLVGIVLVVAAVQLFRSARTAGTTEDAEPSISVLPAMLAGAAIGLLAGLTGTGGGIFLTPLIVLAGWAAPRLAAGISGAFILANSIAGLAGNLASVGALPAELPIWLGAVAIGGLIGAELGARRLSTVNLRRALAVVLVIAGLKLIFLG
ncbi:sulfite exporter TauE/SafE family protein [soil metagenome]